MKKRTYTAEFKTKIILEVLRGERELNEIAAEYQIAPNQIRNWKSEFLENATVIFDKKHDQHLKDELAEKQREADELAKKVGQLTMENDFLKKNLEKTLH
jgi:transposase-like protein